MKSSCLIKLSIVLIIVAMYTLPALAQFAGGSGTRAVPYKVATLNQLQLIADTLYLDKHFIQTADIDASETADWNDGKGFIPIGSTSKPFWIRINQGDSETDTETSIPFTGSYNGNNYTINNLTINRGNEIRVGLFGFIRGAKIRNVILKDVQIHGVERVGGLIGLMNADWESEREPPHVSAKVYNSSVTGRISGYGVVGGLVGSNLESVIFNSSSAAEVSVEKIYVDGDSLGGSNAGGLLGRNNGTIYESNSTGDVSGKSAIGGLLGHNEGFKTTHSSGGTVIESYATGNVTGKNGIGGLIGVCNSGTIKNSFATGLVSGEGINTGGLIGGSDRSIVESAFAMSDVTGHVRVGGLIGRGSSTIISNTYATGAVSGDSLVGGLMGSSSGEISTSYASGSVSGSYHVGGLVGQMHYDRGAFIHESYWDQEATNRYEAIGNNDTDGAKGLLTKQMTGQDAWIFMHKLDFENTWQLTEGHPALRWLEPADSVEVPEAAIITVSERELDFGIVATGDTAIHKFRIVNKGNVNMQAEIMLPVPTEDHSIIFSIIAGEGTYQLEPGSTHSVEVVFLPKFVREYAELILLMHDAQNENEVIEIRLMGSGKEGTSAEEEKAHQPDRVQLLQNYPNPFNPSTRIRYSLPESAHVTVEVFDIAGRHVATLVDRLMPAGEHATNFDAGGLSSGIYVYRMSASGQTLTRRMTLIR